MVVVVLSTRANLFCSETTWTSVCYPRISEMIKLLIIDIPEERGAITLGDNTNLLWVQPFKRKKQYWNSMSSILTMVYPPRSRYFVLCSCSPTFFGTLLYNAVFSCYDADDDCRLVECSVSMCKSCSQLRIFTHHFLCKHTKCTCGAFLVNIFFQYLCTFLTVLFSF